jgi:hypothetical protein
MKTLKYLIVLISLSVNIGTTRGQMIYLPEGFNIKIEGDQCSFTVLPNYTYIGTLEDGSVSSISIENPNDKGWISCTCNTSGTCLPGQYGSLVGCGGTCSNCTMKQGKVTFLNAANSEFSFISGGFVDYSMGIRLATKADVGRSGIFDELLNSPQFKTDLDNFVNQITNNQTLPKPINNFDGSISAPIGYVLQPIIIYGRGCIIVLPEGKGNDLAIDHSSKTSCSCSKGKCSLKTRFGASYCDGDCSGTCTLFWGVTNAESPTELFVSSKF